MPTAPVASASRRLAAALFVALASPAAAAPFEIDDLVRAMSVEEKLALVRGAADPLPSGAAGYVAGVPRLGIPPLRTVDGPAGIEARADATALPSPEALAASFDPELAERYGRVLGREARALGADVVLAPHVNIARVPWFHRVKDELGEDPLLTAKIGAGEIRGIQAEGAMAMVKHLAANDQFHLQDTADFRISERALAEIHLPPFEAAVKEAKVASVMCAYNRVNGPFSCAQRDLLTTFLRDRWGFSGFVASDWDAARARAFEAGLDVEMPGTSSPSWYGRLALKGPEGLALARLDRAATRVLGEMKRFGLLDGASPWRGRAEVPARPSLDVEASAKVAREVATRGAVLLKNDGGLLPLTGRPFSVPGGVALIGPTAGRLAAGAGVERAFGFRDRQISPYDALRRTLGREARLTFRTGLDLDGVPIPSSALSFDDDDTETQSVADGGRSLGGANTAGHGLVRMTADDADGEPSVDPSVDFVGSQALEAGGDWVWAGLLTVPETGVYDLLAEVAGGGVRLQVADRTAGSARIGANGGVAHPWSSILPSADGLDVVPMRIRLVAGHRYQIKLRATGEAHRPMEIRFAWVTPEMRRKALAEAVAAAKAADAAVVFVHEGGQPPDRDTLALPTDQDELVHAIADANPNTVVVVTAGRAVTMPWLPSVKAVLLGWYPGQEGGWALADLLLGRTEPGGRLPLTFPKNDAQTLDYGHPERYRGADDVVAYSEGVFVGYRWWDEAGETPLFPFGHGLSYGRFVWSDPEVRAAGAGFVASLTVKNLSDRPASDVVQLYLERPASPPDGLPMPPKALAGFARVDLAPGEARRLTIPIDRRRFEVWDETAHGWRVVPGERSLAFAASSRDIRARLPVTPDF